MSCAGPTVPAALWCLACSLVFIPDKMIVRRVLTDSSHSDPECLADRKWWCFLLSSILSFIVGVFSVLFIRACAAVCCRKVVPDYNPAEQKKQVEEEKRVEGGQGGDFMSGAKDWAGELISGQTGTGRILVSGHT